MLRLLSKENWQFLFIFVILDALHVGERDGCIKDYKCILNDCVDFEKKLFITWFLHCTFVHHSILVMETKLCYVVCQISFTSSPFLVVIVPEDLLRPPQRESACYCIHNKEKVPMPVIENNNVTERKLPPWLVQCMCHLEAVETIVIFILSLSLQELW